MASLLMSKLCCSSTLRIAVIRKLPQQSIYRSLAQDGKETIHRAARRQTLRDRAMAPAGDGAFSIGKGALAGGAALGIGALAFYGLGLSNEAGALEKSSYVLYKVKYIHYLKTHFSIWPQYVKDRIKTTYMYFGGSLVVTVAGAMAAFRSPLVMNIVTRNGFMVTFKLLLLLYIEYYNFRV